MILIFKPKFTRRRKEFRIVKGCSWCDGDIVYNDRLANRIRAGLTSKYQDVGLRIVMRGVK